MLENLGRIQNPLTRGLTAAVTVGSVVTMAAMNMEATAANGASDPAEVVFTESGKTATWRSGDGSLLEFSEANDLNPAYSCRQGICGPVCVEFWRVKWTTRKRLLRRSTTVRC